MDSVKVIKEHLFNELRLIVGTTAGLLRKVETEHWGYRPHAAMRTLGELAQHLALVPAVDLLILQEHSETEIRELEGQYAQVIDADKLAAVMEQGTQKLVRYMEELSDEQFLTLATKPFYLDHPTAQVKWLIEIVTHAQHHRAQLFTYLKQLSYPISMFDLYAG